MARLRLENAAQGAFRLGKPVRLEKLDCVEERRARRTHERPIKGKPFSVQASLFQFKQALGFARTRPRGKSAAACAGNEKPPGSFLPGGFIVSRLRSTDHGQKLR